MEQFIKEYQVLRPVYEEFNEKIQILLKELIKECQIKFHLIEARTKSIDSFSEKIARKEYKYTNPLEEILDLAGIRIIVYYVDDVEKIEEILNKEFEIDIENSLDKGKLLKINEFGYQSVHYIISLTKNRKNLSEWRKFSNFKAEVQIRTVLQHSWASISHELEYKKKYEIPSVLQRKLYRLASLVELADEEFKRSRDEHNDLVSRIANASSEDLKNNEVFEEINLLTLENYIKSSARMEEIEKEARRAGFLATKNRLDDRFISEIINHCNSLNIRSITELDNLLSGLSEKYYLLFKAQKDKSQGKWTGNAIFFVVLLLIYTNIKNLKDSSYLSKEGWNKELAERVLSVFREIQ